jgi:hypothetical protein
LLSSLILWDSCLFSYKQSLSSTQLSLRPSKLAKGNKGVSECSFSRCVGGFMGNVGARDVVAVNVSAASVRSTMRQLHDELVQLLQRRAAIMQRIGAVKKTVVGLAALFGDCNLDDNLRELLGIGSPQRVSGLTSMCRRVLMEASQGLSAQDVLKEISAQNPSLLAAHKDPLASIATVLNRLVDYGEAQRVQLKDSRRGWKWAAEPSKGSADSNVGTQPGSARFPVGECGQSIEDHT